MVANKSCKLIRLLQKKHQKIPVITALQILHLGQQIQKQQISNLVVPNDHQFNQKTSPSPSLIERLRQIRESRQSPSAQEKSASPEKKCKFQISSQIQNNRF